MQPWWLDAVAEGQWDEAVVHRGGRLVARMPFYLTKKFGFRHMQMPPLTQHLGPWLQLSAQKYANRISEEIELMNELIAQLPRFDYFFQRFHYGITNWLPFYWAGFDQTTYYTYVLEELQDEQALWQGFRESTRRQIRKAQKIVQVRESEEVDEFLRLNRLTFRRQGKRLPYSESLVHRLDEACRERGARKILLAQDGAGRAHAALYLVWDSQSAYYLMGGADPDLRQSGASSLLMWEAIRFAATVTKKFDFEGSMVPGIERFFRSFGAVQKPYFKITKAGSLAGKLAKLWTVLR